MFFWYDYIILVTVPFISTIIGIHFGCFGNKQVTTKEYLSGGKTMNFFSIALSVTVSHFSAVTIVGVPADVYKYGAFYWLACVSTVFLTILAICIYYPILFKEQLTSTYEYLEKRFDHKTRIIGSLMYILFENLLLPIIVYSPSLALSVVTGINVNIIAVTICAICVFYTTIGGLRTVIWTDIFQFAVIMCALLFISVVGIISAGGISSVWNKALAGQRLDIFDFDLDPTRKDSFFICVLGFTPRWLFYLCLSQSSVQKYLSLRTFRDCKRSIMLTGLCFCIVVTFCTALGLIIYANYANCDPLLNHKIRKIDEIVPYYVQEVAQKFPGVCGLLMAALVSAAISTLSSSLNALSGVIYKDFVVNFFSNGISEKKSVSILKIIIIVEGILCTTLLLLVQHLGELTPLVIGTTGLIDGPSLGLFTLAFVFRKTNAKGAFYGVIGGMLFIATIYCTSTYYKFNKVVIYPSKPLSAQGCNMSEFEVTLSNNNYSSGSTFSKSTFNSTMSKQLEPHFIFQISPTYYCLIGTIVTIALGCFISCMTKTPKSSISNAVPLLAKKNSNEI